MSTTISDGTTTLTAASFDGYETSRRSRNVVHPVIGTNVASVTYREAALRSGAMTLVFETHALALEAEALLAGDLPVELADTDVPAAGFTFAVTDDIAVSLHDVGVWLVKFGFAEVAA